MGENYVYIRDLREQARAPEDEIVKQTLHNDDHSRVVLFRFAPGRELAPHTAPFPAILTFLKGEAILTLGADEREAVEGTMAYMAPNLEHGIRARTEVVMLLTIVKNAATPAT